MYTVYDRIFGGSPAKSTVYTASICIYVFVTLINSGRSVSAKNGILWLLTILFLLLMQGLAHTMYMHVVQ
jgi:hypothetical protein